MDQLKIIYGLDTDFMHKSTTTLTVLPKKKTGSRSLHTFNPNALCGRKIRNTSLQVRQNQIHKKLVFQSVGERE